MAAAWKGSISIHAQADDDRPKLIEAMENLVAQIAKSAVGGTSLPRIVHLLPSDGLVLLSERLVAKDLMSHAFLPGGVAATYEVAEDKEGTLFFSELAGEPAVTDGRAARPPRTVGRDR